MAATTSHSPIPLWHWLVMLDDRGTSAWAMIGLDRIQALLDHPSTPRIEYFACVRFGHDSFTPWTLQRLIQWLCAEHDFDLAGAVSITLEQLEQLLRDASDESSWSEADTVKEWAKRFHVHRNTMSTWFRTQKVRNRQVGGLVRVHVNDLPPE